ncbi:MAG: hypothetical protein BJ554DRAFT_463 [Olpidium bornovanus]|uniref:Palmitoyltransferase n=1 Tax=Olpidium bornovanus TaxID=278681 RepID=A0A8H7ZUC5_9FUNG|nr:MAG: hypothetical protein BJ554DRAFT_463 [Olpidium bornovanus]
MSNSPRQSNSNSPSDSRLADAAGGGRFAAPAGIRLAQASGQELPPSFAAAGPSPGPAACGAAPADVIAGLPPTVGAGQSACPATPERGAAGSAARSLPAFGTGEPSRLGPGARGTAGNPPPPRPPPPPLDLGVAKSGRQDASPRARNTSTPDTQAPPPEEGRFSPAPHLTPRRSPAADGGSAVSSPGRLQKGLAAACGTPGAGEGGFATHASGVSSVSAPAPPAMTAPPYAFASACGVDTTTIPALARPPRRPRRTRSSSSAAAVAESFMEINSTGTLDRPGFGEKAGRPTKISRHNAWYRRHGFHPPYNVLFFLQWAALAVQTALYFAVLVHLPVATRPPGEDLGQSTLVPALVVPAVFTLVIVVFSVRSSLIDTMDYKVKAANVPRDLEFVRRLGVPVVDEVVIDDNGQGGPGRPGCRVARSCYICNLCVDEGTRHCKTCNKCIRGLDHHCKFLNTCVGEENYR